MSLSLIRDTCSADLRRTRSVIAAGAAREVSLTAIADPEQQRAPGLARVIVLRRGEDGDAAVRAVAAGRRAYATRRSARDRDIDLVANRISGDGVGVADAGALAGGNGACIFF